MNADGPGSPPGGAARPELTLNTWKEFDQNVITHSAAHHLMAIDDLVGQLGYARVSDIARRLNITRGSVSISLQPLKKAGLVAQDENRHLRLSAGGQQLVAAIKTKRLLIERLLVEVLGVEGGQAGIDACKLEHLVSNATAQQMLSFLRFLDLSPAGRDLIAHWRGGGGCDGVAADCPSCEAECLARRLESEPRPPQPRPSEPRPAGSG